MHPRWKLAGIALATALLCACHNKTETGYEPRKLDMTDAQRRALYADPFTPGAGGPEADHKTDVEFHRPGS